MNTVTRPLPDNLTLTRGAHDTPDDGLCLTEAVAYIAGEPHTDMPQCCSPVLAAFGRAWNDGMRTNEERAQLIPYVSRLVGTNDPQVELQRGEMALQWLIREYAPAWLDLAGLGEHAAALRVMGAIDQAALNAARDAAGAAAWDAARDAAGAAAWDAAGAAARAAAGDAAWDAAGAAARAAARDAARDAARAAAGDAAWAALEPTIQALQVSAHELFDRMIGAA